VTFGSLRAPEAIVALAGLAIVGVLLARRVTGALLIGIGLSTVLALLLGVARLPQGSLLAVPHFETFGQADLRGALHPHMLPLLVSILLVDFFDTIGTSTAIAEEAGLVDRDGRIVGLSRLLVVDSVAASIGGLFGASSVTSYIESAARAALLGKGESGAPADGRCGRGLRRLLRDRLITCSSSRGTPCCSSCPASSRAGTPSSR
jgi:AGZA family xanthine/uracil permease-like MFS transporter